MKSLAIFAAAVGSGVFLIEEAEAQGKGLEIDVQTALPYKNRPGNEFQMRFTSAAAPEGRMVKIDPDDMVLATYNGRRILVPRYRFMEKINTSLPNVPGGPSPAQIAIIMQSEQANTVDAASVQTLFLHLVHDHKVPQAQINEAMKRCYPAFGLPMP